MARNLIVLVAVLAAGMFAASAAELRFKVVPSLEWTSWGVKINAIGFTDSVTHYGQRKDADGDSIFIVLDLMVTNISHKGSTFIPQNTLKIIVGSNEFDAADWERNEETESYVSNIEPTLTRDRRCYFELPLSVIKDSLILRFSGFLTETKDITVSIVTPDPAPETQSAPVPAAETVPETNVVSAITSNRWSSDTLIVSGTLTNASAVPVTISAIDAKGFDQDTLWPACHHIPHPYLPSKPRRKIG